MKLSKLKFVDGKRFKRGIDMDVNNQLLSVALKTGAKPDFVAMDQGVDAAGYVAVEWFTLEEGKLKAHLFRKVGE